MFASPTVLNAKAGTLFHIGIKLLLSKKILLNIVSIPLYIDQYSSPVIGKRSFKAALIVPFLGNCRATLRKLVPCAGIPLENMSCLSVKT